MTCEPGDVFEWNDGCRAKRYYLNKYGHGPFLILKIYGENHDRMASVDLMEMPTGRLHKWSHPVHWGKKNEFLSAAYKATHGTH